MKVVKTISKNYEVELIGDVMLGTISEIINARKSMNMKTKLFENCFICGDGLELEKPPSLIEVTGLGNRFCCEKCKKELLESVIND